MLDEMNSKEALLTAATCRDLLDYDRVTGAFVLRQGEKAGRLAGRVNDRGYVIVTLFGRPFKAHRLAWLHVKGSWPVLGLDHINGDRSDNRIENLREAAQWQNMQNAHRKRKNSSGFTGVQYDGRKGLFRASITTERKTKHLGWFDTARAASEAYQKAKTELHTFASQSALLKAKLRPIDFSKTGGASGE